MCRVASCTTFLEPLENRRLLSWGASATLIGQDQAYTDFPNIDGSGQTIAIIDTGADVNHPALNGWNSANIIGGWNFVDRNSDISDPVGHGTMIAGLLGADWYEYQGHWYRGLATGANLIILKVDDGNGNVPDLRIKQALDWVIAYRRKFNITAVNLAIGDGNYLRKTSLPAYGRELATLDRMNVFVAAASGNDGTANGVEYPAADPHVVAVGSVGNDGQISDFATTGPDLGLLAPGENIPAPTIDPANGHELIWAGSGSSFSAPFAIGAAVLLRQINPRLTNAQIVSILRRTGTPVTDPLSGLSFPLMNIDAALWLASGN